MSNSLDQKIQQINQSGVSFVSAEHVVPNGEQITGWAVYLNDKDHSIVHLDMFDTIFNIYDRAPSVLQRYPFASMLGRYPQKVVSGKERVNTFVEAIQDVMSKETDTKEFIFRGVNNVKYLLQPSLARNKNFILYEEDIIASAKFAKPNVFKEDMRPIELLAIMQHFGIPTRLLDVTENALVALYFACQPCLDEKGREHDGVVYIFKNNKIGANHALQSAVADSSRIVDFNHGRSDGVTLEDFLITAEAQPYWITKTSFVSYRKDEHSAEEYVMNHLELPQFVTSPAFSIRQQIQQGKYILFHNAIEEKNGKKCFVQRIDPLPFNDPSIIGAIKISASGKKRMLKELRSLGITERSLFNDDIDKVCSNIKKEYE